MVIELGNVWDVGQLGLGNGVTNFDRCRIHLKLFDGRIPSAEGDFVGRVLGL